MKKYFAISENGETRCRYEVTNKVTGEFVLALKEIIPCKGIDDKTGNNRVVVLTIEDIEGKTIIKKIGIVKTLNFCIDDCDDKYNKTLFAYLIKSYENENKFKSLVIEQCLISEA